LPEATIAEFNPITQYQGEALAAIATDPLQLAARYVKAKTDRAQRRWQDESGEISQPDELAEDTVDRVAALLQADPHGLLVGFERVNRSLERFLQQERLDLATHGITVPSAMAQHHSALMPWEVANKDLPQGAIVAYYRSPFANIGSAAIGVNNHRHLRWVDEEAHDKSGVAYLNPWTAQQVAVTDFDKDANGYFVGFVPTSGDEQGIGSNVAAYLRAQLTGVETLSPEQQYEAGRAAIDALIEDCYAHPETALIKPADYPIAVTEIIQKNAPALKPPNIVKPEKIKHDWQAGQESHSAATWRAWTITANNPTGRVANAAMNLRSLAWETHYVPDEDAVGLLQQISAHYQTVVADERSRKVAIPTDAELQARGYPAYHFGDRITEIAQAGGRLQQIVEPTDRANFTRDQLAKVHRLLTDFVDGPMAENLQTAVDVAKSKRGIDENIYKLSRKLAYKEHLLRASLNDPTIYQNGKLMPTNTQEPIGWGVEQANALYAQSRLRENPHHSYYNLLPNTATPAQQQMARDIAQRFNELQQQGVREKNIDKMVRANQQPTLTFITSRGNQVTVQCPIDVPDQADSPVWEAVDGVQPDWTITIEVNAITSWHPEPLKASLQVGQELRQWDLGYIAATGTIRADGSTIDLSQQVKQQGGKLVIHAPELMKQPPIVDQPPAIVSFQKAQAFMQQQSSELSASERQVIAGALWHRADTISAAITGFLPEITAALTQQQLPRLKITGLQYNRSTIEQIPPGQMVEVQLRGRMSSVMQENPQTGQKEARPQEKMDAFLMGQDGALQQIGTIGDRDLRLPNGTVVKGYLGLYDNTVRSIKVAETELLVHHVDRYDAKSRSFDETPIQLSFSSQKAGEMLVHFQEDDRVKALGIIKITDAKKVGLSMQTIVTSPIQYHDQNHAASVVGTLIIAEVLRREQVMPTAAITLSQDTTESAFHPNRADLRAWYQAIVATASHQDPRLGEVQTLGKRLNQAFCAEHGLPLPTDHALVSTPIDYWHPQVTLTPQQNQARLAVVERAQQLVKSKVKGAIER
jgi:hypothetical protein